MRYQTTKGLIAVWLSAVAYCLLPSPAEAADSGMLKMRFT